MDSSPNRIYPVSTELERHYSIFSIALKHEIGYRNRAVLLQAMKRTGWKPHDYIVSSDSRSSSERSLFRPRDIFTPAAHQAMFGSQHNQDQSRDVDMLVACRLNPKDEQFPGVQSLLLSLDFAHVHELENRFLATIDDDRCTYVLRIDWADLWLFNDQTGILSFKVTIQSMRENALERKPGINDLNRLNRRLRWFETPIFEISYESGSDLLPFWQSVVFQQWLGVTSGETNLLGSSCTPESFRDSHIDRYTRYAKLVTMAQVPDLASETDDFLINAPVTDPPIEFQSHTHLLEARKWSPVFSAYQLATVQGYPTKGDYLLYDLASTGDEGNAAGLSSRKDWQVSPEYLRSLFATQGIEIWEYWRGMALHDALAFLSYDRSMPIGWQAEAYYYPLYVYHYHVQHRLNCFSEEIIDQELSDVLQARGIKNDFNKFRNQYWFRDLTKDFQGLEVAKKLKAGMGIEEIYNTVEAEIAEISDFINDKIDRGKQSLIAFLVLALYPIIYLFDILDIHAKLLAYAERNQTISVLVTVVVIILLGSASIFLMPRITSLTQRMYSWFYRSFQ